MPYHAKKLLSFFHTSENKCIPKWVKLVTPIIHNSGQIAVNLFGPQRVPVIPHIVIQAADIKQHKPTIKTTYGKKQQWGGLPSTTQPKTYT